MSTTRSTVLAVLLLSAGPGAVAQAPPPPPPSQRVLQDAVTIQAFDERVNQYVTLHRFLEGWVLPLRPTQDIAEIQASMRALGQRIQLLRANARQGDLITSDLARIFRRQISCLSTDDWAAILDGSADDDEGSVSTGPTPALRVNIEWPENVPFGFMPPQLLAALPQLPPELQYRIIGNALVLWDHHANLIVDFLPGAFTAAS
jgi:hypothetical protein